jgi:DNA-binding beta-propeller fold protein YncE
VQYLCRLNAGADVRRPRSTFARFILGEERQRADDRVSRPYGMAFWQDKLYVCDSGARRGLVFDFAEKDFRTFGEQGPFQVQMPINVSLGPDGEKYVTDTVAGRVFVLDSQDQPVRALGARLGMKPCDVVWHEGELYIADLKTDTIRVLDPVQGVERRRFGGTGSAPGKFFQPTNLALGPAGHLFVCDTLNARVQVLDRSGGVVRIVGSRGRALGQLVRPKGIAVDRAGRLYVCDAAAETVLLYNREGRLLMALGGPGPGPGGLSLPAKVAISYDGTEHFAKYASPDFRVEYLVFVSNQLGPNKICVYGFGVYTGSAPVDEGARFVPGPQATGLGPGEGFS